MDKSSEKDFGVSLAHRIEHLRRRKERSEAYSSADPSKLDAEQLKVAQSLDEITGMLIEAERAEKSYRNFALRKVEEEKQRLASEVSQVYVKAQQEAAQSSQDDLALISDFLRLAANQYERGGAGNVSNKLSHADVAAVVGALHLFYAGGEVGAQAMTGLIDGGVEQLGGSGVSFGHLRSLVAGFVNDFESTDESDESEQDEDSEINEPKKEEVKVKETGRQQGDSENKRDAKESRPFSYADAAAMGPTKSVPKATNSRVEKEPKESKETKASKDSKVIKDSKEHKEVKEVKETKDFKESRENKDMKEPKDSKDSRDNKELREKQIKRGKSPEKEPEDDGGFQVVGRVDKKGRRVRGKK